VEDLGEATTEDRLVTLADAVAHPNWSMGQRISIDSASMFNKALEMIEARYLFDVVPDQIEVIVHPQSIIHSMVGFEDGTIMAHLGPPDMRGAIGYAFHYPERRSLPLERLDFQKLGRLDFEAPDPERFPSLRLAQTVLQTGGLSGAILNGAKEAAIDLFVAGEIGFLQMAELVETAMDKLIPEYCRDRATEGIEAVREVDGASRALIFDLSKRVRRI
jgi:1-deoxy-D-xylulose-5-phosphate reductoisomerase